MINYNNIKTLLKVQIHCIQCSTNIEQKNEQRLLFAKTFS